MTRRKKLAQWLGLNKPEPTPEPLFAERTPAFDIMQRPGSDDSSADWERMDQQMRARYSNLPILLTDAELPQHDRALPAARINALRMADERATAGRSAQIASQAQLERDTLARAIAALPFGMRQMIEQSKAALDEAEQQLAGKNLRLLSMDASEDPAIYVSRHSQLTSAVDGLEDLVKDRRAEYRRLIERASERLDDILDMQRQQAAQAEQEAKARYSALQAEARAELGRLAGVQSAIGKVRSQVEDARVAEAQIGGRMVTPVAQRPDRQAERESRALVALQLQAGAK